MTYLEMKKKDKELLLNYYENGNVLFRKNVEIFLVTGETIICDIEDVTDTCNDDEEDILELEISFREESPSWPFSKRNAYIDNNLIKNIRLL